MSLTQSALLFNKMSSSPIPKKGSFSKANSGSNIHRRAVSFKMLKPNCARPFEGLIGNIEENSKSQTPEKIIKFLQEELKKSNEKNHYLKKKIHLLKEKSSSSTSADLVKSLKDISNIQSECLKLIDSLFDSIEKLCNSANKNSLDEVFEMKLIESLQVFQKNTDINTSFYLKKVLNWRHSFCNDLISPAESIKNDSPVMKKNNRSVSTIIASTIKIYAVALKDSQNNGSCLSFRKGEIIEIAHMKNGLCEGRIGDRKGMFSAELVKIV